MEDQNEESNGVLIAIDWENIRRGAHLYQTTISPEKISEAMYKVGSIFGTVIGGKVFGDWNLRPDDGKQFKTNGISPYQAPRTIAGKDRSDPSIILEVYDWLKDKDECKTVILGSGDSDFQALVDRAKKMDKRIILCAFSASVARDILASAPLFPLEAELGIQLSEHGDVQAELIVTEEDQQNQQEPPLETCLKEMYKLENRMSFVGYNMLCSQWMLDWGVAWNDFECRRMVEEWITAGYMERHEVSNPHNPTYPTSAVRISKNNETVRQIIGLSKTDIPNPVIPTESAQKTNF